MAELKPGYLNKGERNYTISLLQLSTLMMNVYLARSVDEIGWQHARQTFDRYYREMETTTRISQGNLETGLWACNMLDEQGRFWHPDQGKLRPFVRSILNSDERYDYYYSLIREDTGERKTLYEKKNKKD